MSRTALGASAASLIFDRLTDSGSAPPGTIVARLLWYAESTSSGLVKESPVQRERSLYLDRYDLDDVLHRAEKDEDEGRNAYSRTFSSMYGNTHDTPLATVSPPSSSSSSSLPKTKDKGGDEGRGTAAAAIKGEPPTFWVLQKFISPVADEYMSNIVVEYRAGRIDRVVRLTSARRFIRHGEVKLNRTRTLTITLSLTPTSTAIVTQGG